MGITSEGYTAAMGLLVMGSCSYALGRLQEYLRRGKERDDAYREGYDHATHTLWTLAVKEVRETKDRGQAAPVVAQGRHHVNTSATKDLRRRADRTLIDPSR